MSFLPQQVEQYSEERVDEEGGEEWVEPLASAAHPLSGLPQRYHNIAHSLKSKVKHIASLMSSPPLLTCCFLPPP